MSHSDFFRGLMVRYINPIWPFWDLEDTYPQYAEFQLADNILHLIYNQGRVFNLKSFFKGRVAAL